MQRIEDAAYAYAMDRFGRRQLRYLINKGHCDVTVAEVDDQVIGFGVMLFRRGSTVARVFSLAVRPEFQSRGTTSALWGYTRPRLLERGYDRVHCEVRVANGHAADYF
jgi:ribosomal protein S18 acetylase RimI-like enzyme